MWFVLTIASAHALNRLRIRLNLCENGFTKRHGRETGEVPFLRTAAQPARIDSTHSLLGLPEGSVEPLISLVLEGGT